MLKIAPRHHDLRHPWILAIRSLALLSECPAIARFAEGPPLARGHASDSPVVAGGALLADADDSPVISPVSYLPPVD